jgi:PAS domain S-box-containing protein
MPDKISKWRNFRRFMPRLLRSILLVMGGFWAGLGLLASAMSGQSGYDPVLFAIGVATLLAFACVFIAYLLYRNRILQRTARRLSARCETLADNVWTAHEAEMRTRAFAEMQGDLIVRRRADGHISYANQAFCALAGQDDTSLLNSSFYFPVLEQATVANLSDGTRIHDQKIASAQGERWIAWREATIRGTDGAIGTQSVGRDVTDRVTTESALAAARDQADAASRAKSRFLATVSHEIRTPLNGILGMADLLQDTRLTPEQSAYVRAVKTSGETLLSLIGEILDLSKIEAGRLDIDARPFDLSAMIEDVTELLSLRAQAKGLEIASYVDERLPVRVLGDEARLRQVLTNLVGNAIKFTETGGVAIVVEPGIWPGDISFKVRDTGIGISRDEQDRIFGEFEQSESGSNHPGAGLGLAICKRIVERMQGRISVESAPGAGALFEVAAPLPPAKDATDRSPIATPDLSRHAVMIVAPANIEAALLARRLTRWGAKVAVAPNEAVAVALLPERSWDAVLIDQSLGRESLTALLQATRGVPCRLVTMTPQARGELEDLKAQGFSGYLIKPVRAVSLAARLRAGTDGFAKLPDSEPVPLRPQHAAQRGGLSVLVAEDNEVNVLLARALLQKLGHRPVIASNGVEALDSFRAAQSAGMPYDLILMDVRMDGLDGLETTRRIRQAEAAGNMRRTPIIALTANAFPEHREACIAAGMDGFLAKPLDREKLEAVLTGTPIAIAA